ncbi:MAG: bile acid:sodium symporter, partial [Cyclobacteriaceae bacterium]
MTGSGSALQDVTIQFSNDNIWVMNLCLAIIMFSVALSINVRDFREIFSNPKAVLTGLFSQYFVFPFITFLLVLAIRPQMGLALGMILIAACPGGNISNFFSLQSRGNVALSVSLTVMATLLA